MKKYDVTIIGGGIAGICIAEMFSRDNLKVLLIEKNKNLISQASTSQHGWFHFGSLYAILENNQTLKNMLNNLVNITKYYSHFKNMNLTFSKKKFRFKKKGGWFNDDKINYYVASRNDKDLKNKNFIKYLKNVYDWEKKIKLFVARHKIFESKLDIKDFAEKIASASYKDYSKKFIAKPDLKKINLNPDTHFKISGLDRTLNTEVIVRSLLQSYLGNNGELKLKTNFKKYSLKQNTIQILTSTGKFQSKYLINASGKNIPLIRKNKNIKNFVSPIGSFYPALCNENFVRLSPKKKETLNHLIHYHDNKKYSVISSALSFPYKKNSKNKNSVKKQFESILKKNFKDYSNVKYKKIYNGVKTEYIDKGSRNYNYKILSEEKNKGVYTVIPGKFTLSFSLAVEMYKLIFKKAPRQKKHIKKNKLYKDTLISISKHNILWR